MCRPIACVVGVAPLQPPRTCSRCLALLHLLSLRLLQLGLQLLNPDLRLLELFLGILQICLHSLHDIMHNSVYGAQLQMWPPFVF